MIPGSLDPGAWPGLPLRALWERAARRLRSPVASRSAWGVIATAAVCAPLLYIYLAR